MVGYNFGSEPHRHAALEESLNEGATRGRHSAAFERLVKRYRRKEISQRIIRRLQEIKARLHQSPLLSKHRCCKDVVDQIASLCVDHRKISRTL